MNARLGEGGAPPALPIGLLWLGAAALLGGCVALALNVRLVSGPVQQPGLVALVHVFTLGFTGLVFAGTLQQLPAVMLVTKLAWPRLGYVTAPLLVLGTAAVIFGLASGFAAFPLAVGGIAVSLAWLLLLVQLLATAGRRWPIDAGSQALLLSVVFLTLTVVAGFALASARSSAPLAEAIGYPVRLHLTLGLFGAFLLGIIGSGQKLLGMFALSKSSSQWRVRLATQFIAVAVTAEAVAAFSNWQLNGWPVLFLAAAALLQLLEVHTLYRQRLRRVLEPPIWRYVMAHALLAPVGLLFVLGRPVEAATLFLIGYIGLVVSGMLVKITSFLTWTAAFAGSGGGVSRGAPLLRDLLRNELEPITTWGLGLGAIALTGTMLSGWLPLGWLATGLLLAGALSQFIQVSHIIAVTLLAGRRMRAQPA